MRFFVFTIVLGVTRAAAAPPGLDDPRLLPARAQLEASFAAATRDGVPDSLLEDKLKEGLAKNVPAPRIVAAVSALESRLAEAARLAAPRFSPPPPGLLRALGEARAVGVQAKELEALVAVGAARGAPALIRALDALTDLAQRGYPVEAATRAVTAVVQKHGAVDKIASDAQALMDQGPGPDKDRGIGPDKDRGPNRETSGQRGPGAGHGKGHP